MFNLGPRGPLQICGAYKLVEVYQNPFLLLTPGRGSRDTILSSKYWSQKISKFFSFLKFLI